jgi:glyoxylase-like metal-dependent hydrolase (beta-lactamase superfamily II)
MPPAADGGAGGAPTPFLSRSMTIGPYTLHPVETGRFALDGGAMFGVVPKPLWKKTSPPDERNRIAMAARALLLQGNGRRILIDTGNGSKFDPKLQSIYKMDTSRHSLLNSLAHLGVAPDGITDVILTHLHFDHAGGATIRENNELRPTFPKATYYVQREHWEAAFHPTERDRASFFADDFMPLHERGVLRFTEGEGAILPGITVKVVHGHTSALQCPVISDGQTTLFYCADLMPMTPHVQLPWIMAYDLRPLVTLEEKRAVLNHAADDQWILFFEHDPDLAAARIRRGEKGFTLDSPVDVGA